MELRPDQGDRPLALRVEVGEREALRLVPPRGMHPAAELLEGLVSLLADFVVADRDEEVDLGAEPDQLRGRHRPAAGRLLPALQRGDDRRRAPAPARPARSGPTRHVPRLPLSQIRPTPR